MNPSRPRVSIVSVVLAFTLVSCTGRGSPRGLDGGPSDAGHDAALTDVIVALPVATITAGAETGFVGTSATFQYSADVPSATFECGLDGAFEPCPLAERTFAFVAGDDASTHTFAVRASAAGMTGPVASRSFTVDALGPSVAIVSPGGGEVTSGAGSIVLSASSDAASYACTVDTNPVVCSPPTYSFLLPSGAHSFTAQAVDALGNPSATESVTWTVDASPPLVTSLGVTDLGGGTQRVSFTVADASSIVTIRCALDGGSFVDCGAGTSGSIDYAVSTGHFVEVYAIDAYGNSGVGGASAAPPNVFARIQF